MSKTHIYTGTSLKIASKSEDVIVHPPIVRGDLINSKYRKGDSVLIIDGFFHQRESVDLTEIKHTIHSGILVYGTSSMGALRAVEAQALGMKGFGYIYRLLRRQAIVDDEIVAQLVNPIDYTPITYALIDVYYAIKQLRINNSINDSQYFDLVRMMSTSHYSERDSTTLISAMAQVGANQELLTNEIDQGSRKKRDAIIAVERLGLSDRVRIFR